MPRREEIPEILHPILQYNAITLSDNNWNADVMRLGRVLSYDIPSSNERKVHFVKRLSLLLIFLTLTVPSTILFFNILKFLQFNNTFEAWKKERILEKSIDELTDQGLGVVKEGDLLSKMDSLESQRARELTKEEIFSLISQGGKQLNEKGFDSVEQLDLIKLTVQEPGSLQKYEEELLKSEGVDALLEVWQSATPYLGIGASCLLLFYIIPLIDWERRKYLFASISTGAIGVFIIMLLLLLLPQDSQEAILIYMGAVLIATGMLSFMNMSGFKLK